MKKIYILNIVAALAGALIADRRGRGWLRWGIMCSIFPPLVFLVYLLPASYRPGLNRPCPNCHRIIPREATECPSCKHQIPIEMVQCPECARFVPHAKHCQQCGRLLT